MERIILRDVEGTEDLAVLRDRHIAMILRENTECAVFYAAYTNLAQSNAGKGAVLNEAFSLLMLILLDIDVDRPDISRGGELVDTIHAYYKVLHGSAEYTTFLSHLRFMLPSIMQLNPTAGRLFQWILFRRTPEELRYDTFVALAGRKGGTAAERMCPQCGVYLKYGRDGHVCLQVPAPTNVPAGSTQKLQRNWGPVRFEWLTEKMAEPRNVPFTQTL